MGGVWVVYNGNEEEGLELLAAIMQAYNSRVTSQRVRDNIN